MLKTLVLIYREAEGSAPLLEWLDGLPEKAQDKITARVELLAERGHELRRPHCDYLEHEIYELRVRLGHVQYRILYAFVGLNVVLLSHGCTKEDVVPKSEIARALRNLAAYKSAPAKHTYSEQE
ncbi:MAG: type II toxin-antitoxin system RelE/ParE family toxin [Sedimentisphaerales bacterium]|nr:type II toxin-antitoxin system RelE/ParE family toxin [Sedimentisphaerales bacterium]